MNEAIQELITRHAPTAHWYIFGALILAGFNLPFSADALILLSAFLAAVIIPEHTWHLFFSALIGCYLSAMCAYWVGRILGPTLQRISFFSKIFYPARIDKIHHFYEKYGLWTLMFGRFIPFGVRNCIFMTAGLSKMDFIKFILRDSIACSLWCGTIFYAFYTLGQNFQVIWETLKTFNLVIFAAFSVTVIGFIWYKRRKKDRSTTEIA